MSDRGLFIGRFQPFHLGHLDVVKRLSRAHDEVVVGIGSANVSHTWANPFTAGERVAMIHATLREAGIPNVILVPIPDVGRNALFPAHVASFVPRFRVLYTNNPLMTRLFSENGYRVEPAPFHERAQYEGSRIRRLMKEGDDWRKLVPDAVARGIDECDGIQRLRDISREDHVVVEGRDPSV